MIDGDELRVEELGNPEPPGGDTPPPSLEEPLEGDGELEEPLDRGAAAESITGLLRAGFHVTGLGLSRRLAPGERRDQVVELWAVSDAEARPVGESIAAAIPERWLRSRALAHSPAVAAVVQLGALIQARAVATAAIYQEETDATRPDAGAERAEDGARSAGAPGAGGDARGAGAVPVGVGPDGHTSAGLGLDDAVQPRPARRAARRGAESAG